MTHRLLGLCGSLRCASTNALHLREACRLYAPAEWEESDLRLPLCGGDLEADAGIPDAVARLVTRIAAADAVVIATPEYNKALSGVLKSALGWISRIKGARWRDKPVAVCSAAAGRCGGDRAQFSLRLALVAFQPRLLAGPEVMIANTGHAFNDRGRLTDEGGVTLLTAVMQGLRHEVGRGQAPQ